MELHTFALHEYFHVNNMGRHFYLTLKRFFIPCLQPYTRQFWIVRTSSIQFSSSAILVQE